jgi:response regulator RpfG family c-di-GMP phosphodiesterase
LIPFLKKFFLLSNHSFAHHEDELQETFMMINIVNYLAICIVVVLVPLNLFIIELEHSDEIVLHLTIYGMINLFTNIALRTSKTQWKLYFYLLMVASIYIVTVSLYINTLNDARLIWFALPIFGAAFVGGKYFGRFLTAVSVFIILFYYMTHIPTTAFSMQVVIETFIALISIVALVALYENRVENHAKVVNNLNANLQAEVRAQTYEIEATQRELLYRLGELGESRSKETGNHVKRVAEYSKLLAQKAGLDEEEIDLIYVASPMHDIGKIGIPDAVLHKPGDFTTQEWEVMKTHSELGFVVFEKSERPILKKAAEIAYAHHEKWDGSGYPQGLKGEEIPLSGRIVAIADVFDALGSSRCYKEAWSLPKILTLLEEGREKHFDPELVNLFLTHLDEFLMIRDRYVDAFTE